MSISLTLAEFIKQTESVPRSTQLMSVQVVLDLLTAAIAGFDTEGAKASRTAAQSSWGKGEVSVWFTDQRMTAPGAAFVNSTMASMLDLDDGHRAAAGHPGAAIIPAVLAQADLGHYTGEQLLTAIALGYEIAVRISAARDLSQVDTLVSGRWCAPGVAAAVGWLRNLDTQALAQALSIAATCAPNLNAVAYSNDMGNHVKEGIPWATVTGITAVDLAEVHSTGPLDFLDNADTFSASKLLNELGKHWMIEGVYFKPYSCCRWAHAAIDAILLLEKEESLLVEEIEAITIKTFARALQLDNDIAPKTLEAAQYSIPFCVALAKIRGSEALLPLRKQFLYDESVLRLASIIDIVIDPELDAMFSKAVPAELIVKGNNKRYVRRVLFPKGEPANPMLKADLIAKLKVATHDIVSNEMIVDIEDALTSLEVNNPDPLRKIVSAPMY